MVGGIVGRFATIVWHLNAWWTTWKDWAILYTLQFDHSNCLVMFQQINSSTVECNYVLWFQNFTKCHDWRPYSDYLHAWHACPWSCLSTTWKYVWSFESKGIYRLEYATGGSNCKSHWPSLQARRSQEVAWQRSRPRRQLPKNKLGLGKMPNLGRVLKRGRKYWAWLGLTSLTTQPRFKTSITKWIKESTDRSTQKIKTNRNKMGLQDRTTLDFTCMFLAFHILGDKSKQVSAVRMSSYNHIDVNLNINKAMIFPPVWSIKIRPGSFGKNHSIDGFLATKTWNPPFLIQKHQLP